VFRTFYKAETEVYRLPGKTDHVTKSWRMTWWPASFIRNVFRYAAYSAKQREK